MEYVKHWHLAVVTRNHPLRVENRGSGWRAEVFLLQREQQIQSDHPGTEPISYAHVHHHGDSCSIFNSARFLLALYAYHVCKLSQ